MRVRVSVLVVLVMVAGVRVTFAQGAYVSAAVMADIVRSTHSDVPGLAGGDGGGEAIGFALRAGTPLGAIWGLEVEFARPGEIEREIDSGIRVPVDVPVPGMPLVSRNPVAGLLPEDLSLAAFAYRVRSTERNATLSAALWLRQELTGRLSMVYLGGMAFTRSEYENEVTYAPFILTPGFPPSILPPTLTRTTVYGVQPLVGVESRVEMTDHLRLVPGLRMQASDGRWLIRPSVGLAWNF